MRTPLSRALDGGLPTLTQLGGARKPLVRAWELSEQRAGKAEGRKGPGHPCGRVTVVSQAAPQSAAHPGARPPSHPAASPHPQYVRGPSRSPSGLARGHAAGGLSLCWEEGTRWL